MTSAAQPRPKVHRGRPLVLDRCLYGYQLLYL